MRSLQDLRFLVVEDHGFQRWLLCDMLEHMGVLAVEPATDGAAALARLATADPIDIVISDLDMPGMDGMRLIRHIAERKLPTGVVVLSAQPPAVLAAVEAMAREYGVNVLAAFQKPLTPAKLASAVEAREPAPQPGPKVGQEGWRATPEEIAEALRNDEFEPFFQPKVEVPGGRTVGAEALVRWRHPKRGTLSPGAFIATMERSGQIDELTRHVARRAMATCRQWRAMGCDGGVAINLSALSLVDTNLAEDMTQLARSCEVEPRHVTFEVTESAAADDLGSKLENLSRLRMKGFLLSIDDFGTGYSSMSRLSRFPFTELKIDQTFVAHVAVDGPARAIVESSLGLAERLGIGAVAEGVESRDSWEALLGLGCKVVQGYYLGKPMPEGEYLDWLRNACADCA